MQNNKQLNDSLGNKDIMLEKLNVLLHIKLLCSQMVVAIDSSFKDNTFRIP